MTNNTFTHLSDRELLEETSSAAACARTKIVELIELLGEVDARRLYLPEGFSSLFTFCVQALRFSEDEAYHRIAAARAARAYPAILGHLRNGALTLTTVTLLRPHLTPANADSLIAAAIGKSKREVEYQMACLVPEPDVHTIVRRLPEPIGSTPPALTGDEQASAAVAPRTTLAETTPQPAPRPLSVPLSSDRFLLRVTLSAAAHARLRRAQDLLRHSLPTGDLAEVIDRALTLLVDDLERRRMATVKQVRRTEETSDATRSSSRYVPAAVRREVWRRDAGRCAFVGAKGRCAETGQLELHHVEPFALGGSTTVANLELRCRAHNQYEAALLFDLGRKDVSSAYP